MVCPSCKSQLTKGFAFFQCQECFEKYPIVFERVPVLVREPRKYLANNIIKYWKYSNSLKPQHVYSEEYKRALQENVKLFEELTEKLSEPINFKDLRESVESLEGSLPNHYSFYTGYLMRDWAGDQEGEDEISVIKSSVKEGLLKQSRALVLGAGLGRIACEISDLFSQIVAIDYEPNMPFFFEKLRTGGFTFADIHHDNSSTESDKIRWIKFSPEHIKMQNFDNVDYLISDAREIPFENNYFDAVISVYFTDVLPMRPMLREVRRVLRDGGKFVHFGPLEYHFSDVSRKYSFETFASILRELNFTVNAHDRIELSHCKPYGGSAFEIFKNWKLYATKESEPSLSRESYLSPTDDINYTITGAINGSVQTSIMVQVSGQDPIKISEEMFDVMKCVEAGCSVLQLMARLEKNLQYENLDEEVILLYIESLRSNGILKVNQ